MLRSKLTQITSTFISSKLYLIFQSFIFLTIFLTLIYTCIKFISKDGSFQFVLQLALVTFIGLDIGLNIIVAKNFMIFMSKLANVLNSIILVTFVILVGIKNYAKLGRQQYLFISACNVIILGVIQAIYIIQLSKNVCKIIDKKNKKLVGIDYNSYQTQEKQTKDLKESKQLRNFQSNLPKNNINNISNFQDRQKQQKYQKFVQEQMVQSQNIQKQGQFLQFQYGNYKNDKFSNQNRKNTYKQFLEEESGL